MLIFAESKKLKYMNKEVRGWDVRKGDYRSEDEYARIYRRNQKKEKIVKNTLLAFTAVAVASLMYLILWVVAGI
ncbi:MAG: hypothetical protein EDM75_02260 [Chlorobiota bacterium]|nr:MAG: hypothetical protein EDM75_02260 [Chlorobiota bacterium]